MLQFPFSIIIFNLGPAMDSDTSPEHQQFKHWFHQNGGFSRKIIFPATFGSIKYTGIAASQNIKANQVFLAIPKKLIISVSKARDSQLGPVLEKYSSLNDSQNQQTDFNILTLYLIWQKMLGPTSFYHPYIQILGKAQTIVQWSDQEVQNLCDPYISLQFVAQSRKQFLPIYKQFFDLSTKHPQLFKEPISWELFMECFSLVMTRCFGWGLPQTMMVPYADFLNHSCHGVHHYTFNKKLEQGNGKYKQEEEYVPKRKQLDLTLLGIDNRSQLPISYAPNKRQKFINDHRVILQKKGIRFDPETRLFSSQTKEYLNAIHKQMLQNTYDVDLHASSNSQDNDSEQDDLSGEEMKQRVYFKQLSKLVKQEVEHHYEEPKPIANKQFEDNVTFQWWDEMNETDSYFIVAADQYIRKGQQIFNSYGRRNNRFLLAWYGFTHQNNKYDSIGFRFWDQSVYQKTGKLIFAKFLTQKDWYEKIKLGNERYAYETVTDQYRLKKDNLCYQLMAYLRLRIIRRKQVFKALFTKKQLTIHKIQNLQLERLMLDDYQLVLTHLKQIYQPQKERQPMSNSYRTYFASNLINSNREIIYNHFKGISILRNVVDKLQKGKALVEVYQSSLTEEQQKLSKSNSQEGNKELINVKYWNRRFTLDYFKMLSRYFQRIIKK